MKSITAEQIRDANVRRDLAHWQHAPAHIPLYVANGWIGGSCDAFGFHSRPQRDMDHGRTQFSAQMHYARKGNGGHDLQSLAALRATLDGSPPGLAGLTRYRQELDLFHAELRTEFAWGAEAYRVAHFASWALPQYARWAFDQHPGAGGPSLSLDLCFATAAWDNNKIRPDRRFDEPALEFQPLPGPMAAGVVTSRTNCRETRLLVAFSRGSLRWEDGHLRMETVAGASALHLLLLDERLEAAIADDPLAWLGGEGTRADEAHRRAAETFWSESGLVLPPPGRERLFWLRGQYYLRAGLAPYPSHVQIPTGLNGNIWSHGFLQDMYYVVENLPRVGLDALADAQLAIWREALPAVLRYTRRITGLEGAFYPWTPPFEDWDGFETREPIHPDSFEFHNSAYATAMVWGRWLRGAGADFLAEHLPMLREIARFYLSFSGPATPGDESGPLRLRHPRLRSQDEAMEPGTVVDTPIDAVWSAHFALRCYRDACDALGDADDPDLLERARCALARGYDLKACTRPDSSLKSAANDPRPPGQQKHPVQLNPIALLPMPDLLDAHPAIEAAWRGRMDLTRDARIPVSCGWTFALFALASARMGDGQALAADLDLIAPSRFTDPEWIQIYESSCLNGWQHKKSYYLTAQGLYQQAITDAVLQDWRGFLDFFAAIPPDWRDRDVRFRRLRSLGGVRVDGDWQAGRLRVRLVSDRDLACRLRLPAAAAPLHISREGGTAPATPLAAGSIVDVRLTAGAPVLIETARGAA